MTQQTKRQAEQGFTLVELAIVMIIIGLLIGGILKGQELIANARVTSTVNQVKGIDAAMTTFRDQYSALPGDMANPDDRLPNCTGYCATNGTGDGRIQNATANDPTAATGDSEGGRAFVHLAAAGVLGGINSSLTAYAADALPDLQTGAGKLAVGYSNGTGANLTSNTVTFGMGTYLVTVADSTTALGTGIVIPKAAGNIDRKLDDGAPNTGSVRAAGADCADGNTNTAIYQENRSDAVCGIAVRIQQ